jgi:hypothetical protein
MASSLTDPKQWTLPNPERVLAALKSRRVDKPSSSRSRGSWVIPPSLSPVDLYAYLKSRFGSPNGFAMSLRTPFVDNFIHWQYTLECSDTVLDLTGLNMRTEIHAYSAEVPVVEWRQLESNLQAAIAANQQVIQQTKRTFEHWHLFSNPYRRLSAIVDRWEKRLREIAIPKVQSPPIPATREQVERFEKAMATAKNLYHEATELCVTLDMLIPVMGEAAVNFLILVLAKPEIRNDQRMREDFGRRPIDVRIKSLSLVCEGFARPVTGSEEEFKSFLRIMNQRNDTLHGNIDPRKSTGEEIFFDSRTIPLLPAHRSFGELALASALTNLSPQTTLDNVNGVRKFIEFLLSLLRPDTRADVTHLMEESQLGYRTETGTIGAILPAAQVDFFPMVGSDLEAKEQTQ